MTSPTADATVLAWGCPMKMSVEVFLVLFWVRGSATFCCVKFLGLVSVKPMGRWIRCINEKRKVKESNSRAFTRPGFQDQLPTNGCYLPYAEN